jgi:hypothetical protein
MDKYSLGSETGIVDMGWKDLCGGSWSEKWLQRKEQSLVPQRSGGRQDPGQAAAKGVKKFRMEEVLS